MNVSPADASQTRVLLIEDSALNRELLCRRLARRGFDVEVAADGLTGYELALSSMPDVVLMDMSLPQMDGWEATSRLRSRDFRRPIIGLTAHALTDDRNRAIEAGCDDFITKPVDFEHLVTSIRRLAGEVASSAVSAPVTCSEASAATELEIVVAGTLADHSHDLNNVRAGLIAVQEIADPAAIKRVIAEAEQLLGQLTKQWNDSATALYEASVGLHSARDIVDAIATRLGLTPGPCTVHDVRCDLGSLIAAALALAHEPTGSASVRASVNSDMGRELLAIEIGPLAEQPRPEAVVGSLIRKLFAEVAVLRDPPRLVITLPVSHQQRDFQ